MRFFAAEPPLCMNRNRMKFSLGEYRFLRFDYVEIVFVRQAVAVSDATVTGDPGKANTYI